MWHVAPFMPVRHQAHRPSRMVSVAPQDGHLAFVWGRGGVSAIHAAAIPLIAFPTQLGTRRSR